MEKEKGLFEKTVEDLGVKAEDRENLEVELSEEFFEAYKDKATQRFKEVLLDKISWISENCWPINLKSQLEGVNQLIEAGRKMGATTASVFGDEEIKKLAEQFAPFRVLEMKEEVRYLFTCVLSAKGVDHKIFLEAETITTQK